MTNYKIAFAPDLDIDTSDFVNAWNDTSNCREMAEAKLDEMTATDYDSSTVKVLALLGVFATGVATNAIYDLIKTTVVNLPGVQETLEIKNIPKNADFLDIQQIDQPDGSKLLIIVVKEK
ncbi:hypothetical protein QUF50_03010 [Thiotrichales bacterium HSG1]|nr:hypothetical protein [Thiotrichales bacterium HSG1]